MAGSVCRLFVVVAVCRVGGCLLGKPISYTKLLHELYIRMCDDGGSGVWSVLVSNGRLKSSHFALK